MKKVISCLILLLVLVSCNKPNLNGHYHLEWGNRSSFQTWNIKNNRIRINDSVCDDRKQICYGMPIKFKGDSIFVPWVDTDYAAKYQIDKKGTITMTTNYNDNYDTLRLFPKENCLTYDGYFNQKTKNQLNNFNLLSNSMMYGKSVLPKNYKNELIIGKSEEKVVYIFNDKVLNFNSKTDSYNLEKSTDKNELWIHIDEKIKLNEVTPILKEIHQKGYSIFFSSKERLENNEQVRVLEKSIVNIDQKDNSYVLNSCEYCEKHPTQKIDSIVKFTVFDMDSCIVNDKMTDFFQLRNHTVRFLKQNRTTRLNSQIQLEINSKILFKDYIELMTEIDFVNNELLGTTYRDSTDIDYKIINEKQFSYNRKDLEFEFPLRIKEIIKPF